MRWDLECDRRSRAKGDRKTQFCVLSTIDAIAKAYPVLFTIDAIAKPSLYLFPIYNQIPQRINTTAHIV